MNKNKIASIVIYAAAVICFICAGIWFSRSESGFGVVWMCIGIAFMISGTIWKKKSKDSGTKNRKE